MSKNFGNPLMSGNLARTFHEVKKEVDAAVELPKVNEDNNGDILSVVDGKWSNKKTNKSMTDLIANVDIEVVNASSSNPPIVNFNLSDILEDLDDYSGLYLLHALILKYLPTAKAFQREFSTIPVLIYKKVTDDGYETLTGSQFMYNSSSSNLNMSKTTFSITKNNDDTVLSASIGITNFYSGPIKLKLYKLN